MIGAFRALCAEWAPDARWSWRQVARATTVRPDPAFEVSLTQAMLRSERLRLGIMAAILGVAFGRWVLEGLLVMTGLAAASRPWPGLLALIAVSGAGFAYELYALFVAGRALRLGLHPPALVRYRNAFVETSLPTLVLLIGVQADGPSYLYVVPVAWFYFPFIILATLRLDFWLCVFTGLVAAVEYAGLSMRYLVLAPVPLPEPGLASPGWLALRTVVLLGCGLLAGLVSLQIRRQFAAAFQSTRDRDRVVSMFGQHVSPAVVEQLLRQDVDEQGETREVCVMFLDIQDFTTFAESRSPEQVVAYLNGLFSVLIEIVNRHTGIVNKFLGDGFMAVFGAPIEDDTAARNAVAAALEMVERVATMSAGDEIAPTIIRIGLHAGTVVTGNIGSADRKEYTVIGDVVNLASRLEQLNKQFGSRLIVSESVARRLGEQSGLAEPLGSVQVKGRVGAVEVYRLA